MFVAADVGLQYTNAYTLVFIRFLLATAFVGVLVVFFDGRLGVTRELRRRSIWFLGGIDAVGFLLQYLGQSLTNASDATLLANLAPVLVPLVAWRLSKEPLSKIHGILMMLGLSGLVLMASPNTSFKGGSVEGDMFLFGASASFAFFIVLSKRLKAVSTGSALAVIVTITLFLAPAALLLGKPNPLSLSIVLNGWYSSIYMGIACTVIPMALYLRGLRSISSSESGTLLLLEALSGLTLAVSLLGQVPTGNELVASATIVAALTIGVVFK